MDAADGAGGVGVQASPAFFCEGRGDGREQAEEGAGALVEGGGVWGGGEEGGC